MADSLDARTIRVNRDWSTGKGGRWSTSMADASAGELTVLTDAQDVVILIQASTTKAEIMAALDAGKRKLEREFAKVSETDELTTDTVTTNE